jgi:hypothetical protein
VAIYHCSVKTIGRSAGRSATAAAAYRAGIEITDERTGEVHDYTRRGGVLHTEIMAPDHAPEWANDRAQLWNAVEKVERRKDAQLCREVLVALPAELDDAERLELVQGFAREQFVERGMVADIAWHEPDREGDQRNHHAHILLTMRDIGADGFGQKNRDWNRRELLQEWREQWQEHANRALERAGRTERIDHRSLQAQGIDREATTHLGPVASEMERRGRASDRGDGNRQVMANNAERKALKAEIIDLNAERKRRHAERQFEAMPAAEVVEKWDTTTKELAKGYRQRADRLEHRLRTEIHDIGDKRYRARVDHAEQRPAEVKNTLWNRVTGKVAEYAKALADWQGTMKRIEGWKQRREADLGQRLKRLDGYLSRTHYGHHDKATTKAERTLARKYPAWAQRVPAAREQVAVERAQQRALQQAAQGMAKQIVSLAAAHQKGRVQGVSSEFGRVLDAVNAMPGRSSQKAATLAAELRERPDLMQTYQPLIAPHQRTLQRSRGGMGR